MADANHAVEHGAEGHSIGPKQYIYIALFLAVITVIELILSYSDLGDLLAPILIVLSAVKFATVVAYFMHLRFESVLFTRLFVGSFVLGGSILIALISLSWTDATQLPF